ncbi:MAG: hypothetical protein P1P89_20285 [Desulfobacterales bacterium]|nr:hypothetical protein [Desulfobacterales bacterium]
MGGWRAIAGLRRMKIHAKSDERILGDSDVAETVLGSASEAMERKYRLKADGYSFERVAKRVGEIFDISKRELTAPGKHPVHVKVCSVLAYWAVHEIGMSATEAGLRLGWSQSAASRAVERGRIIVEESGISPVAMQNA